jgi:NAD(P)-dependent dehydrogenase (short-subunit alcohol dehydrogenase family)
VIKAPLDYAPKADALKGLTILITGAGDGIGRVAAYTFAKHGATVILLGRTEEKLDITYDEIVKNGFPEPAIVKLDLATLDDTQANELAAMIESEFGTLDGILHNASLLGRRSPIENFPPETWTKVMQVNVNAAFLLTRALLPLMHASKNPSIVFTSSSVGRQARAHWGVYGVSKFATEGLAMTLADELEEVSRVRVNTLNPGATRTQMRSAAYPAENPADVASPHDLMPTYLYLFDEVSLGVSGQQFNAQ